MSDIQPTVTPTQRGPFYPPPIARVRAERISGKAILTTIVVCAFFMIGGVISVLIDPQAGKGIAFVGVLVLCFTYPSLTLWAYLLIYCTLPQMANVQIAQAAIIFQAIMALNIFFHLGQKRELSVPRTVWIAYAVYFFVVLKGVALPTAWSADPTADIEGIMVFAFAVLLLRSESDRKLLGQAFVAASIILSIWSILKFRTHVGAAETIRVRNDTKHLGFDPNQMSEFIGFGLMITLAALLEQRGKARNFLLLPQVGHVALAIAALGVLASRGSGPIAVFVATILMIVAYFRKPLKSVAAIAAILVMSYLVLQLPMFSLLMERFGNKSEVGNASGRTVLWSLGLDHVFSAGPSELLFGGGGAAATGVVGTIMHNQFLESLVDYGLIGCLMFGWLAWWSLKNSYSSANKLRTASVGVAVYFIIVCMSLVPASRTWGSWGWLVLAFLVPVYKNPDQPVGSEIASG